MSADIPVADVPVVEVIVQEDRARVIRRGTVAATGGAQRVTIAGAAPVLADKTLVARSAGAEIVDVRARRTTAPWRDGDPDGRAAAAALVERRARLEVARANHAAAAAGAAVARSTAASIDALIARSSAELAVGAAWGVAPADAAARLDELTAHLRREHAAAAALAVDVTAAAEEVERLAAQVAELERGPVVELAAIEVDLVAPAAGPVDLEVAYVVPGACWRPYHTATLRGAELELATDACVWQATGEDWLDVVLRCSTARPSLGAAPPVPVDDVLTVQPKSPIVAAVREQAIARTGEGSAGRTVDQVPGVDDGGTVQLLTATGRARVPADGRPNRIRLGAWTTPVEASRVAYPELAAAVFLRTRQTHAGTVPILAGPVDLVRDGGLTGRTTLLYVAPGERFVLGWGADPALRVHRTHHEKHDEAGVLSSWSQTRHRVAIRLSNLGAAARTVIVTERIPVSELADKCEVILRAADAWQLEDEDGVRRDLTPRVTARTLGDDGMVSWTVELPPRQRRAIAHEYVVKLHTSVS